MSDDKKITEICLCTDQWQNKQILLIGLVRTLKSENDKKAKKLNLTLIKKRKVQKNGLIWNGYWFF